MLKYRPKKALTFTDVAPRVLDGRVAVHVGELTETEAIAGGRRVSEAVHYDGSAGGVKRFTDPVVQLVVNNRAPGRRLAVVD